MSFDGPIGSLGTKILVCRSIGSLHGTLGNATNTVPRIVLASLSLPSLYRTVTLLNRVSKVFHTSLAGSILLGVFVRC